MRRRSRFDAELPSGIDLNVLQAEVFQLAGNEIEIPEYIIFGGLRLGEIPINPPDRDDGRRGDSVALCNEPGVTFKRIPWRAFHHADHEFVDGEGFAGRYHNPARPCMGIGPYLEIGRPLTMTRGECKRELGIRYLVIAQGTIEMSVKIKKVHVPGALQRILFHHFPDTGCAVAAFPLIAQYRPILGGLPERPAISRRRRSDKRIDIVDTEGRGRPIPDGYSEHEYCSFFLHPPPEEDIALLARIVEPHRIPIAGNSKPSS